MLTNIDKDALLAELRNSTQDPRAVELVIHRLETGAFEEGVAAAAAPVPDPTAEAAPAGPKTDQ